MQAIGFENYGAEEVLKKLTLPRPIPTPNQALIRVAAAGIR
jgi:NADPH:quinone reductase-like Zn-dependent oxidoreductase